VLEGIQSRDGFGLPAPWQARRCLLDSSEQLMECLPGSMDYDLIKARLEEEMGTPPTMLKVEMKANVDLLQRFDLERRNLARENGGDVNEVWLWHATSSEAAEKSILTAALGRAPREATARQDTGGPAHAQVQELSGRLPFAARRRHEREPQEQDGGCGEQELSSLPCLSHNLPSGASLA